MEKKEMLAIHKLKLEEFLKKLELWDSFVKGELRCFICNEAITMENIWLIISHHNEIKLCCNKSECIYKAKEITEDKQSED